MASSARPGSFFRKNQKRSKIRVHMVTPATKIHATSWPPAPISASTASSGASRWSSMGVPQVGVDFGLPGFQGFGQQAGALLVQDLHQALGAGGQGRVHEEQG